MMKKLLIISFLTLAAVSCKEMYGPDPAPRTPEASKGITIEVSNIGDSSFTAVIKPIESGVFFSYILRQENSPSTIDSTALFKCTASGAVVCSVKDGTGQVVDGAQAKGCTNAAPQTLQFSNLQPNTSYVLYAVAGSLTGIPGKVGFKKISTSDGVNPYITGWEAKDSLVAITFSEEVVYDSTCAVTATLYPGYSYTDGNENVVYPFCDEKYIAGTADCKVIVAGNQVLLNLGSQIPGTCYAVNFPENTFSDYSGLGCAAVQTAFIEGVPTPEEGGIYGRYENAEMALDGNAPEVIRHAGDSILFKLSETSIATVYTKDELDELDELENVSFTVKREAEGAGSPSVLTWKLSEANYGADETDLATFWLNFPEVLQKGDLLTLTIPSGVFVDNYGNKNPEITYDDIPVSYLFSVSDILGTWTFQARSGYDPERKMLDLSFTIEESDVDSLGNILITSWFGLDDVAFYTNFDTDLGRIDIPCYSYMKSTYESLEIEEGQPAVDCVTYWYSFAYGQEDMAMYTKDCQKIISWTDYPGIYYETYKMPESGDEDDITDDDCVGYANNIFIFGPGSYPEKVERGK